MTNEQPEKLDLRSHTIAEDKIQELLELFPEIRTEGGKIDFDRLKLALGHTVDVGRERYGMNWPGKADCFKTIQQPSMGTLLPCKKESVNFDSTENLIIEGDNLEVLKLLQKSYLGKVKMIYIDPPYNTGNDFIYPDNYTESLQTYLEYSGQLDGEGRKYSTNTEADGRFHSKWMNMMYPRLYLARNLLREDGVIFVNTDDTESANIRSIMNDVFGEDNFLANIAWEKRYTRSNNAKMFYSLKDSITCYRKSDSLSTIREKRSEESKEIYSNPDNDPRGIWTSSSYVNPATKEQRKNLVYKIVNPNSYEQIEHPTHAWKYEYEEHMRHVNEKRLWWGQKGDAKYPRLKNFLSEIGEGVVPIDLWSYQSAGTTDEGGLQIKSLFNEAIFDNPKPTKLIIKMMNLNVDIDRNDIILDFFAGSGTTAHAVLDLNRQDGGNRKFILVQLPEPTGRDDYKTIADITKERVRRVIQKITTEQEESARKAAEEAEKGIQITMLSSLDASSSDLGASATLRATTLDLGFKVFKLSESNFKTWNTTVPSGDVNALEEQLELHIDHIKQGRSQEDILFEILLKSGFPLSTKIEALTLADKTVYSISEGAMLICLERDLTHELIKAIADLKLMRVACLDEGFSGNDQLKTNAVQTMKTKGVLKFWTI